MDRAQSTPGHPWNQLNALNPEAGAHAICTDPRELDAALRAGERSWRRFPYYEQRYAERGQRFTRSDSAWLVTLAERGAIVVDEQVTWLGLVLASRGMPRWMLELHLVVLHTELVAAVPGRGEVYATLLGAAQLLREQRQAHIDEAVFAAQSTAFARQVGDDWDARLPETGALLVAAVADERAGIARAVPSIAGWMTDPSRFPPRWIDAVQSTLARAREQAS
ncbi:MAG: hypothetical protein H0T76_26150 [Nannocystis sp.]|nr:hypothetical protein [Nannocystis sp.]MBA3549976.1 hypothetical protein [Nannocystis sp.]